MSREALTRRQFSALLAVSVPFPSNRAVATRAPPAGVVPPPENILNGLAKLMDVTAVPGIAIGVVEEGRPLWERYIGVMDAATRTPVTAETLFPAASLSKPLCAFAALRLAEAGQLDLDRPLKAYVPDHAPADARGDKITARHVLSHSSGLRNWRNSSDQPLVPDFDPGTRFQYSGEGFYYLQRAVEKIADRGFEQFMQERLIAPLGMRSSTYGWRSDADARLVTGHNRGNPVRSQSQDFANRLLQYAESKGRLLASFTYEDSVQAMSEIRPAPRALPNFMIPNAAASLLTTVRDYAAFLNRVLRPGTPPDLGAAMRRQMIAPRTRINSVLAWGLGWGLESDSGREYLWHWGDNGNFKNFVLVHLPSRSAVVVFTNGNNGMRVAEEVVSGASGHEHFAFDWL